MQKWSTKRTTSSSQGLVEFNEDYIAQSNILLNLRWRTIDKKNYKETSAKKEENNPKNIATKKGYN